jgi:hypothetical protein
MRLTLLGVAAVGMTLVAAGCSSDKVAPPPIVEQTSNSETGMHEPVLVDQLNAMIDETAQYLVRELPNDPGVKAAPHQLVFAVPPEFEHESRVPDGGVRMALASLKSKLQQSESFKADFIVITGTTAENNRVLNQVAGSDTSSFRDPLQRTADTTKAETYNPADVYVLTGKFYQQTDPSAQWKDKRDYHLFIRVTHSQSRTQVLDHEFHRTLQWNPNRGVWKPLD